VGNYLHPEFGYLAPAPGARREIRVAAFAGLLGAAVGAIGMVALVAREGSVNSGPTVPAAAPQEHSQPAQSGVTAAAIEMNAPAMSQSSSETRQLSVALGAASEKVGRPPARGTDNGPDIARVLVGRPPVAAPAASGPADGARTPSPPSPLPTAKPAPPTKPDAASDHPQRAPAPEAKPPKTVRVEGPRRALDGAPLAAAPTDIGSSGSAYARAGSSRRTVFWDWSR
jgi:DamX protein